MAREDVKHREEKPVIIIIWLDSNLTDLPWLSFRLKCIYYKFYAAKQLSKSKGNTQESIQSHPTVGKKDTHKI